MEEKFGLNKAARLAAERRAKEEESRKVPPVDAPFPYEVAEFDPVFFGVEKSREGS